MLTSPGVERLDGIVIMTAVQKVKVKANSIDVMLFAKCLLLFSESFEVLSFSYDTKAQFGQVRICNGSLDRAVNIGCIFEDTTPMMVLRNGNNRCEVRSVSESDKLFNGEQQAILASLGITHHPERPLSL